MKDFYEENMMADTDGLWIRAMRRS